jgi:hypothetical protein
MADSQPYLKPPDSECLGMLWESAFQMEFGEIFIDFRVWGSLS